MWGFNAWVRTSASAPEANPPCWSPWDPQHKAERDAFFTSVIAADQCDQNWYLGSWEDLQEETDRPRFTSTADGLAPALLGLDSTIFDFCTAAGGTWGSAGEMGPSIAHRCVEAGENVLRQNFHVWNLCVNTRWLLCAVKGRLPKQRGANLHFALAPRELNVRMFGDDALAESPFGEGSFAVSDVYFAELAILYRICANRRQLLEVAAGELMTCELDEAAYWSLVGDLKARTPK